MIELSRVRFRTNEPSNSEEPQRGKGGGNGNEQIKSGWSQAAEKPAGGELGKDAKEILDNHGVSDHL